MRTFDQLIHEVRWVLDLHLHRSAVGNDVAPKLKQFHDVIRRERFTLKSNLLVVVIDHKTVVNRVAAITKDAGTINALICHVPTCDETALRAILRDGFQPRHGRLVRDALYSPRTDSTQERRPNLHGAHSLTMMRGLDIASPDLHRVVQEQFS